MCTVKYARFTVFIFTIIATSACIPTKCSANVQWE